MQVLKEVQESVSDNWVAIPYEVVKRQMENDDLITLTLEPVTDQRIEPMMPGQFNMLYAFGVGEIPISVSSLYEEYPQIVHTIQDVGAVSKACCSLHIGDQLGVRGPFGTSWPIDEAQYKDVLIIAGGVGIAPLKPLIESILKQRDLFGEVNVLYGTRSPDNILFHKDIISWQSDPSINFQITVDHAFSNWHGNVGVVTHLIDKADFKPDNTVAFFCGPEIMMRYGVYACIDAEVDEDNIYVSMERNMKCAIGHCGHCQFGPMFVCKDGAVFPYLSVKPFMNIREL
jgi:NAD(P)H-flavin reductase